MPVNFSRRLTGSQRTNKSNVQLGIALCFVAGAINAGGFLAVNQYTSHMTGIVSSMADNLVAGTFQVALAGCGALLSFVAGATCSTVLVIGARQRRMHGQYALPLMAEAFLLIGFGLLGPHLAGIEGLFVSLTVMLLAFIMGLQNALITKLSQAEIRTTHITGIVTDIGIELGRLLYDRLYPRSSLYDRTRLALLSSLLVSFFIGAVTGAFGFYHMGYMATVPLALMLIALAGAPVADDLLERSGK